MSYVEKCEHCKENFACFHMQGKPCDMEQAIADQAARFHDEIVSRQGTVRANQELDLKERDQLRVALAAERARLDHVLRIECTFDDRADIDNDIKLMTEESKK